VTINNRLDQNHLKTLKVLYVEDDPDTRKQCSDFLTRPVGTLITASNGAEGLEAFIKNRPDIVITDIMMPVMDGLTMAKEIRGIAPTVPIIVITAFEQTDYMMRAINIGIDKYVVSTA
jgi:two-component system cell cycle response regulator